MIADRQHLLRLCHWSSSLNV